MSSEAACDGRCALISLKDGCAQRGQTPVSNIFLLHAITIKYFVSGGIVDMPALFTVDTCGETGALGFSIGNFSNISFLSTLRKIQKNNTLLRLDVTKIIPRTSNH
jgi:hypothetical protein